MQIVFWVQKSNLVVSLNWETNDVVHKLETIEQISHYIVSSQITEAISSDK